MNGERGCVWRGGGAGGWTQKGVARKWHAKRCGGCTLMNGAGLPPTPALTIPPPPFQHTHTHLHVSMDDATGLQHMQRVAHLQSQDAGRPRLQHNVPIQQGLKASRVHGKHHSGEPPGDGGCRGCLRR
jgi:hypothetical protein